MSPDALTVATVALVPAVFGAFLPPLSEVRTEADPDGARRASVKSAALVGAAVVAGVGIAAGRPGPAVVGGLVVVLFAALYTHAVELP